MAGLLIGCLGVVAALALPFAPVFAERTEVAWPGPGQPAVSTTAFFAPYRPVGLTATLPCPVLRAATEQGHPVAVLATAADGAGLLVRVAGGSAQVFLNGRLAGAVPVGMADCGVTVIADAGGVLVDAAGGAVARLPTEPIPEVREFRTELSAARAAGLTVRAATVDPFALRSTGLKRLLLTVQLLAAAAALVWLARGSLALVWLARGGRRGADRVERVRPPRSGRAALAVDAAVLITLAGWAVIGPLSDDDGFAAMIARNSRDAGYQGNYYRWWNASETPFALAQHVLAPLTEVSMGPLWLRMPSTLLAMLTWFALSRGVLPAAVPRLAHRAGLRLLAAGCFLACWLPFNLGVRPEAYLAAGLTCVLALLWRAEGLPSVALATAVAALTVTASPSAVLLAAPVLMFAPKIVRLVRGVGPGEAGAGAASEAGAGEAGAAPRLLVLARVAALCAVGGVALTLVFADQSWHALAVATRWHTTFGPSLPWYDELERYRFLLAGDQDGTATKRVPVLLTLALLPIVGLLLARRAEGRS
ncbi:MAG TPA: arabinosyltransferase domain-containing protein, partial [Pseudonocardia sp.]|nr:arabinosyltransferase domain-containing protein [Pseudonocardia sp.]